MAYSCEVWLWRMSIGFDGIGDGGAFVAGGIAFIVGVVARRCDLFVPAQRFRDRVART